MNFEAQRTLNKSTNQIDVNFSEKYKHFFDIQQFSQKPIQRIQFQQQLKIQNSFLFFVKPKKVFPIPLNPQNPKKVTIKRLENKNYINFLRRKL